MLRGLSIRDIVLVDRLDFRLNPGLCVLTGETGAGKSILLDSLGLALGARADSGLVREGAAQGSVSAEFDLAANHPAHAILADQGIASEDVLVLRRLVGADGRSRAFVNDQPVSAGLLRQLGQGLVEIHGQSAEQGLFDAAVHRTILDAFGGLERMMAEVRAAHGGMKLAADALEEHRARVVSAQADEDYLRHVLGELESLDPQPGEEAQLAETRILLQHGEKLAEAVAEAVTALDNGDGVASRMRLAQRALERASQFAGGRLDECMAALERAAIETAEASAAIQSAGSAIDLEPDRLEQTEERLFALRALARKHQVDCDALPALGEDMAAKLEAMGQLGDRLEALQRSAGQARENYVGKARALSAARRKAAKRLDSAVAAELEPLRLGGATFVTEITSDAEGEGGPEGIDRIAFLVATNPGARPGPLARIASGGELSRFMLALKVALAGTRSVPTLVFDEADRGVGGSTADAVGERLARLAETLQVLVVTHSPQVAARGSYHWRVSKNADNGKSAVTTSIDALDDAERREEVARMLAGAEVTEEARAAAKSLISGGAE